MKKYIALLAALVLALGLCACGGGTPGTSVPASSAAATTLPATEPTTVPTTEPVNEAAVVGGVDLTDLTAGEAAAALNAAAASYQLSADVNGTKLTVSAADIGLKLDEAALQQYLSAAFSAGGGELPAAIFTYDREVLKGLLSAGLDSEPVNAAISYNKATKQFEARNGANGSRIDADAAADALAAALGMLVPNAQVEVKAAELVPEITADGEKMTKALDKANGYLKLSLAYTYAPKGSESTKVTIDADAIAGFISISGTLEVTISKSAIESYAADMASRYAGSDYKGSFVTTGGSTLGYTVTYYGQKVNQSALADDIYKCITEQKSGSRTAPYKSKSSKPYGGTYVEIDLSAQKLWMYKNGEQIVSTKLVSGSVAEGHRTPTGIYSIYAKQTDRYLTGEDYRSFVSYWMPFLGGYGLHDASWRGSFGGTIYHYDGSHGCVNLPTSAAKKIYNNISVGTKVILYGGKTEVPNLEQKLSGTASYTVKSDAASFKLDVKAKYADAKLTYVSGNTNVVTVSADGTVTVKGPGTATITVTAAAFEFYTAAELKVTVTVQEPDATQPTEPQPTEPKPTEPKPTEPQPTEPKPTEPKPTETKPVETKPVETKPAETQPAETQPTESKPAETKPVETQPVETQPVETKPAETKPAETKPAETKPVETKPAETKPVETKPAETKPVETKPAETKPAETKPAETKPVETKPAETQPVETKPAETKPAETQPTEPKPIETKPAETKPTEPKSTEPKPTESMPAETKPTEPKPAETQPSEPASAPTE